MLESESRVRGWIRWLESKVRVDDWSGRLESMVSCQTTAVFDSSSFLFCRRFLQGYRFFFAAVFILLLFFSTPFLVAAVFILLTFFCGRFFHCSFFANVFDSPPLFMMLSLLFLLT